MDKFNSNIDSKPQAYKVHQVCNIRNAKENIEDGDFKIIEVGLNQRFLYVPPGLDAKGAFINLKHVVGAVDIGDYIKIETVVSGVKFEYFVLMHMIEFIQVMDYWHFFCEGLTDD